MFKFSIILFLISFNVFSQTLDLKLIPLTDKIDSTLLNKIKIQKDETLIKFYKNPIYIIGGYKEATNYLCKNGECKIIIEGEKPEIEEFIPINNIFKNLEYDFNTKLTSEMLAFSSTEFNSNNEEIVDDGDIYGIYIQQNLKSIKLSIYEPKYYKNIINKSMNDLVKNFLHIFNTYFLYAD